jgi:hypothetical protein
MAVYNLKGPVDAVQYVEGLVHPNVGIEVDGEYTYSVLYHEGTDGEFDVLFEGDWIVTTADSKNFSVDEELFPRIFEEVK